MAECVVLDVTDADNWLRVFYSTARRIPFGGRSTVLHDDEELANDQAVALAKSFPDRRFAVFKLTGVVATQDLPAHKTLGGAVVASVKSPVWDIKAEV